MVEREKAGEDFLVGQVGGPAVGSEDSLVQRAMGIDEPLRTTRCRGEKVFVRCSLDNIRRRCDDFELSSKIILTNNSVTAISCRTTPEVFFCSC